MTKIPDSNEDKALLADETDPIRPFFYEIRVKGRLSQEKWKAWFDNLSITTDEGETVLRGTVPDHAALYGLIGRLRDLAVPLLFVNVLDADAWRQLRQRSHRYRLWLNLVLMLVYLLLLGGLIALTVFVTSVIHVALALALLFAALGGVAYAIYLWDGTKIWRYLSYLFWPASIFTFFIYLAVAELAHPAVVIATLLFLFAGGGIYLVYYLQSRTESVDQAIGEWKGLSPEDPAEFAEPSEKEKLLD